MGDTAVTDYLLEELNKHKLEFNSIKQQAVERNQISPELQEKIDYLENYFNGKNNELAALCNAENPNARFLDVLSGLKDIYSTNSATINSIVVNLIQLLRDQLPKLAALLNKN